MSGLTVASWPAYRFLRKQVRWSGIPISLRISHSLLWSIQSKFQHSQWSRSRCFSWIIFLILWLISCYQFDLSFPCLFLIQLEHLEFQFQISTSWTVEAYFENFEHYFASVWDECNCEVVWTFFAIAFFGDWNENWPFPVMWPLLSFPYLLAYWVQHFHSIIFSDLK